MRSPGLLAGGVATTTLGLGTTAFGTFLMWASFLESCTQSPRFGTVCHDAGSGFKTLSGVILTVGVTAIVGGLWMMATGARRSPTVSIGALRLDVPSGVVRF